MSKVQEVKVDDDDPVHSFEIKRGPLRPFLVTEPSEKLPEKRTPKTTKEKVTIGILLLIASFVRLYRLSYPNSVVFDEVHFGGFASKYITGKFFMDVHPPLAKMLFAAVGSLAGYNGGFGFSNIGDVYNSSVPYVVMRGFSAVLGVFTVLLMYLTLRNSGVRRVVAFCVSISFAIENSFVTISRYILLDSPMLFFIAAAVYSFKRYEIYKTGSMKSYYCLAMTGLALGLAVSSKWVGLFTVAWVGLLCIWRLWFQIGDLTTPVSRIVKQSVTQVLFLLGIPLCVYLFFFHIHFSALNSYSDGAGFFSSEFRTTLKGNSIPSNILADVGIGSTITIRHVGTMGGYLHSHDHALKSGSKQQQVTLYPHLDHNNDWYVELYNKSNTVPTEFEGVKHGTKIRLKHVLTGHRLHSHDHKPPVSESSDWQKEVSGYGYAEFEGDANDDWIVEIDREASVPGEAQESVKAIDTKFRLRHAMTGCLLFSHEVKLPKWGFEQQEVTCATQGKPHLTLWYVESNSHPLLPEDAERVSYRKPTFFEKVKESHIRMWHINKNLKEPHVYQSDPISWPFLLRGISYWAKDNRQVYFIGNAIVWWSVTAFIGVFAFICSAELFAWQLGKPVLQDKDVLNFHIQTMHYLIGYVVHFLPSFLMSRQLFLHHYLPAYYFGILALGHGLDVLTSYVLRNKRNVAYGLLILYLTWTGYFYSSYSPLSYGSKWTKDLCSKSQWFADWDYSCSNFPAKYADYKEIDERAARTPTHELVGNSPTAGSINVVPGYNEAKKVDVDIEKIIADPSPKKFMDQHGNPLSPEEVKRLVKEEGVELKAVAHNPQLL
ncbi:HFL130Wp [Eremothecium sinecaudum]|uniref:Dolichyl-phosphate-mannose--protein mannosyltransferase n=1 Tax=Eremothecium sinecaudum TaxID=45286 RepID=A0A0X8HUI0_9SACH|nr:HFL130Wp [Eremothecium sinecaudum]AMD21726.1 HFL130Wp [Eremothecium sinecaudum]